MPKDKQFYSCATWTLAYHGPFSQGREVDDSSTSSDEVRMRGVIPPFTPHIGTSQLCGY